MSLRLGDTAPNFTAETTEGNINFYDWLGDSWGLLFSHPADFTPVCTTELGRTAALKGEFKKRNVKAIALSVDPLDSHHECIKDIEETQDVGRNFVEIIRVIDSLQLTAYHSVATPVDWKQGEDVVISPSIADADIPAKFPKGHTRIKPYLRMTPQPDL